MRIQEMDRWDDFSDTELYERISFVSSSVVLTMADAEDLEGLTERVNDEIVRSGVEGPHTLRGLVRYVLGTDIADAGERDAHVRTWLDIIDRRIDSESADRREILAELARREPGADAPDVSGAWSEFDTTELKLRVTREKLTTRFTPNDKTELNKIVEQIKRMRRRRAVETGEKLGGATIGDSLVIRVLIRIAVGRDLPDAGRREHVELVADRIVSTLDMAAQERASIVTELRRRSAPSWQRGRPAL
jgi:hypothetical protein